MCTTIEPSAFGACTSLTSIYLMNPSICALKNSNAFSQTGIWSTKGSIFVPASLVSSYKTATNWAFFSNRIFAYNEEQGNTGNGGITEGEIPDELAP